MCVFKSLDAYSFLSMLPNQSPKACCACDFGYALFVGKMEMDVMRFIWIEIAHIEIKKAKKRWREVVVFTIYTLHTSICASLTTCYMPYPYSFKLNQMPQQTGIFSSTWTSFPIYGYYYYYHVTINAQMHRALITCEWQPAHKHVRYYLHWANTFATEPYLNTFPMCRRVRCVQQKAKIEK